jgi:SAM-dependent methyltransferase
MLSDFGLLAQGAAEITGLDLVDSVDMDGTYGRLRAGGFTPPKDYRERLFYRGYNGVEFPAQSAAFDLVFSWGAFEQIADPPAVLREMRRVCRPDGVVYVNVYPWFLVIMDRTFRITSRSHSFI